MQRPITILGSTGSIGTNALDVIANFPDRFRVVALAAGRNLEVLLSQVRRFQPEYVSVADATLAQELQSALAGLPKQPVIGYGDAGLLEAATWGEADLVLTAVVGAMGIEPTLAAIEAGRTIALANKETLVAAGQLVMGAAAKRGVSLIPVDSEHSALFQCLVGERTSQVERLIVTASGGPFRGRQRSQLTGVTPAEALRHPRWAMGPKVSIDSATLMNKGLEMIEAHWLFGLPLEQIEVLVHPESIIHSLVAYQDGSVMAQLGITDIRLPIQYAFTYPERWPGFLPPLNLAELGRLHFEEPDLETFPSLNYARAAVRMGGTAPAVLNAANEVAVERFLAGELPFLAIAEVVEAVLMAHQPLPGVELSEVFAADRWARAEARAWRRK